MTWFDRCRRTATVSLVAALLVVVPSVAMARFSGSGSGGLAVGTARLVAPVAVTGTYRCSTTGNSESFDVTVAGFSDAGLAGTTYRYQLLRGSTVLRTQTSASRSLTLSTGTVTSDALSTTYALTIQATLGSWTGPLYATSVDCKAHGNASGSL